MCIYSYRRVRVVRDQVLAYGLRLWTTAGLLPLWTSKHQVLLLTRCEHYFLWQEVFRTRHTTTFPICLLVHLYFRKGHPCVLPMCTSWTPMLARARAFDPELRQYTSWVPSTIKTWQVEISPVLSGIDNKPTIKKNTMEMGALMCIRLENSIWPFSWKSVNS